MAISFGSVGTPATGTTALTVVIPSGAAAGQVAILSVEACTATDVLASATATGWTQLTPVKDNGSSAPFPTLTVLWRVLQSGDPGASVSITFANAPSTCVGIINTYAGVDTTTPFEAQLSGFEAGAAAAPHTAGPITTTLDTDWIVTAFGDRQGSTWTPPTGFTERNDTATGTVANLETADSNGTVAHGSITATASDSGGSSQVVWWIGALKAATSIVPVPNKVRTLRRPFTGRRSGRISPGTAVTVSVAPVPSTPARTVTRFRPAFQGRQRSSIQPGIVVKIPVVPASIKTARRPFTRAKSSGITAGFNVTVIVPAVVRTVRKPFTRTKTSGITAGPVITVTVTPPPVIPATVKTRSRKPWARTRPGKGITAGYAAIVFPQAPVAVPAPVKTPRRPFSRIRTSGITAGTVVTAVITPAPVVPAPVRTRFRPFSRVKTRGITPGYATVVFPPQLLIVPKTVKTPRRNITRQDSGGIYPAIAVTFTAPVTPAVPERVRTKLRPFRRVKTSGIATGYKPYPVIIVVPVKTRRPFLRIVRGKISGAQAPGVPVLVFYGQADAGGGEILIAVTSQGLSASDTASSGQAADTAASNPDAPHSDISGREIGT